MHYRTAELPHELTRAQGTTEQLNFLMSWLEPKSIQNSWWFF